MLRSLLLAVSIALCAAPASAEPFSRGGDSASYLYQLHRGGGIWNPTGAACNGERCPGWSKLDDNSATVKIVAA